jgi:hypothetical protein
MRWIPPEQSPHIAKAILLDLEASGFQIVKKASTLQTKEAANWDVGCPCG